MGSDMRSRCCARQRSASGPSEPTNTARRLTLSLSRAGRGVTPPCAHPLILPRTVSTLRPTYLRSRAVVASVFTFLGYAVLVGLTILKIAGGAALSTIVAFVVGWFFGTPRVKAWIWRHLPTVPKWLGAKPPEGLLPLTVEVSRDALDPPDVTSSYEVVPDTDAAPPQPSSGRV